jgi:hypothetical protein
MTESAASIITIVGVAVGVGWFMTAVFFGIRISDLKRGLRSMERDAERRKKADAEWHTDQWPERWTYTDDDGKVTEHDGMAVYVVRKRERDWTSTRDKLAIGHVKRKDPEFLQSLAALRAKAAERASDLNAIEST